MTDSTQASGAQDTTAATQAEGGQSEGSVLTPDTTQLQAQEGAEESQNQDAGANEGKGDQEGKTEQDDQGKPKAPAEYSDFSMPEGVEMDGELLTEFKGLAKEFGLTQEAAQRLVDLQARMETQRAEAIQQAMVDQSQQWADQIKNDPEFGGDNFDSNVAVAVKTIEKFASPELRQLLNDSGLGNHPELVKFCHRIGKAISEDGMVFGGNQNAGRKSTEEVFYPGNN